MPRHAGIRAPSFGNNNISLYGMVIIRRQVDSKRYIMLLVAELDAYRHHYYNDFIAYLF